MSHTTHPNPSRVRRPPPQKRPIRPLRPRSEPGFGGHAPCSLETEEATMLFTIAVILLVLWLLGLVSGYTLGNFIYLLLVIALVLFVVGLISGRRTVLRLPVPRSKVLTFQGSNVTSTQPLNRRRSCA